MYVSSYADDLGSAVHYALETTHAIAVCPFHLDLTIRMVTTRLKAMLLRAPESSSRAMARRGREKPFGKSLDANSGKPLTCIVPHSATFGRPRSYKATRCHGLTTNRNLPARAAVISLRSRRRS